MSKDNLLMTITNDFIKDVSLAKTEIYEHTSSKIHSKVSYPNGFWIETVIESGNVGIKTSHKLIHLSGTDWEVDMDQPY